jgi:hypothetical protein
MRRLLTASSCSPPRTRHPHVTQGSGLDIKPYGVYTREPIVGPVA